MTRILLADDHALIRKGLRQVLAEKFDQTFFGEAGAADEVRQLVRGQPWDVIILDLVMPGANGLALVSDLAHIAPSTPILVLSVHPESQFGLRCLRSGASGYLSKEAAPEELLQALSRVMSGKKYISHSLAEKIALDVVDSDGGAPHENLSEREYQVLCLLASGKTVSEVADALSVSVKTVSTYRARILDKMNMKSNAELTYYAVKNGLVA